MQIAARVPPTDRGRGAAAREVDVDVHENFGNLEERATGFSFWAYAIKRRVAR